jgi:hypothetical protein
MESVMSFKKVRLAVLVLSMEGVAAAYASEQPLRLDVKVYYDATNGGVLKVELVNSSTRPVELLDSFLPWGYTYSMLLVAAQPMDPFGPSRSLNRTTVIDDAIGRPVTIGPGGSLSGTIDLDRQFPGVASQLARGSVVLFWSYSAQFVGGERSERTGGMIVIPKRSEDAPHGGNPPAGGVD